jgi:2-polyprenyl-3-methyl-5-hydroxy-6-metoxy-1,4-benzoquinol methylase
MTTAPLEESFDAKKAEAFGEKILGVFNEGNLALLISIGHQTGLFDLMENLEPSTSQQIADEAGLDERYVREWLGGMVTGGVVEYDRQTRTYWLPAEHAASITRSAGTDNLASLMQYIALFGSVEQGIVECFRTGGGLPYEAFPRFQELMAEESSRVFDETLVQRTLPLEPSLVERLRSGINVADVGCGQGHAINVMAKEFPRSSFTGYDISGDAIAAGRAEARRAGFENARFEQKDVADLDVPQGYDFITAFDAIHDQVAPRAVLSGISKSLRPDGVFLMVDIAASSELADNIGNPFCPALYAISTMHCMTVSLSGGGEGLGTAWGEQKARELLAEAGFTRIDVHQVEGDPLNLYYFCRK